MQEYGSSIKKVLSSLTFLLQKTTKIVAAPAIESAVLKNVAIITGISFIILGLKAPTQRDSNTDVFLWNCETSKNKFFYTTFSLKLLAKNWWTNSTESKSFSPWRKLKLNVHKMFRRLPGRLLNVLCTFNSRPVSRWLINFCMI